MALPPVEASAHLVTAPYRQPGHLHGVLVTFGDVLHTGRLTETIDAAAGVE